MTATELIQTLGYAGIFAILFAETGLPFGFFLPGGTCLSQRVCSPLAASCSFRYCCSGVASRPCWGTPSATALAAETLNLGYLVSAMLFGAMIAVVAVAHLRFRLNAVLAFWIAYILTRPLGASLGDYLAQSWADGGLGLGTVVTSALFLLAILTTVTYLTVTRKDAAATEALAGND